ncbi:MAG TPA: transposase [Verrucomicrobiae bacterium]|nr:transposase [Verrucomicrobiae bacterium]
MPDDSHKHLRRLERVWLDSPVYFVTACTDQRRRILADAAVADILTGEWRTGGERHGWLVGRYVIMPDHVHFFCAARPDAKTLAEFVRLWKQWTTKRMKMAGLTALNKRGYNRETAVINRGYSAGPTRVWQREFFDHVLRSEESYAEKWGYVLQNPVRAGLTARAEDWPFQGEIYPL